MKKYFCAACFLFALLSSGCKPEGIIPPDEMASLLASFYQADAYVEMAQESTHGIDPFDSLRIYRPLLEERGYTDEDFRIALDYYLHHPQTLVKICQKTSDQLDREADKGAGDLIDEEEASLDDQEAGIAEEAETQSGQKVAPSDSDNSVKKTPQRKRRKKMSKEELKELQEQLDK